MEQDQAEGDRGQVEAWAEVAVEEEMGGNRPGAGPSGDCVCPSCGQRVPHQQGMPCYSVNCPKCGTKMARA